MKKKSTRMVLRAFKRTSDRKLSPSDLLVLDFLWTWKVASTPMLKELAFKNKSYWWAYKALKRLQQEKYVQLLPRGRHLDLEVWALTRHGFEVVLMDRDDIEQYRYRVHAPAHDYLGTCLQLGDLWLSGVEADFFTEQQLSALSQWNFPEAVRAKDGHIPDGITYIRGPLSTAIIAYEVDLNLKDQERYYKTSEYYRDGLKPHLIVWLVRNRWLIEKIYSVLGRYSRDTDEFSFGKNCAFILLDEFKEKAWDAKVLSKNFHGFSIRKLHENLIQSTSKRPANLTQKPMREIFFPRFKSPQKFVASAVRAQTQELLTPFGSRGEIKLSNVNNNHEAQGIQAMASNKQGESL